MGLVLSDEAYLAYWEDKNAPMHIQDTKTTDKQLAEDRLIDFIAAHERLNRKSMLEGLTAAIGDLTDAELKDIGLKVDAEIAHRELVVSSRYRRDHLKRRLEAIYRREDGDMTKEVANV